MKAKIDQAKNSHSNLSIKSKNRVGMPSQSSTVVQTQLETTTPGDAYEQEADRTADMVMRKIDGVNQSDAMPSSHCPTPTISCFGGTSMPISSEMESQLQAMQGGGHAMPEGLRAQMEDSFGHDFSNVRLHTDSAAADMSSSINAKAFTHGNDIYFNQGQFQPNTAAGQHLIAHELTHTVQQGGKVAREDEDDQDKIIEIIITYHNIVDKDSNFGLFTDMVIYNLDDEHFYKLLKSNPSSFENLFLYSKHHFMLIFDKFHSVFFRFENDEDILNDSTYNYLGWIGILAELIYREKTNGKEYTFLNGYDQDEIIEIIETNHTIDNEESNFELFTNMVVYNLDEEHFYELLKYNPLSFENLYLYSEPNFMLIFDRFHSAFKQFENDEDILNDSIYNKLGMICMLAELKYRERNLPQKKREKNHIQEKDNYQNENSEFENIINWLRNGGNGDMPKLAKQIVDLLSDLDAIVSLIITYRGDFKNEKFQKAIKSIRNKGESTLKELRQIRDELASQYKGKKLTRFDKYIDFPFSVYSIICGIIKVSDDIKMIYRGNWEFCVQLLGLDIPTLLADIITLPGFEEKIATKFPALVVFDETWSATVYLVDAIKKL